MVAYAKKGVIMNPDSPSPVASRGKNAVASSLKESLIAWAFGVGLGILPFVFVSQVAHNAKIIHENPAANAWLEIFLFLGAGCLLFFKRGSHNARLVVEVTIWVATANALAFKYIDAPWSYALAVLAILAAFGVAYKRGETR
ncbi:MAG: hypothetical protein EON54_05750 [Alcaligenaceae bacterium]|nr:MAG: hypothetical protein EON54_05750 [Alcaligenaceae bacterium]